MTTVQPGTIIKGPGGPYVVDATTPPNRCIKCGEESDKALMRLKPGGLLRRTSTAPPCVITCLACGYGAPLMPALYPRVLADAASPWQTTALLASSESRQELATRWTFGEAVGAARERLENNKHLSGTQMLVEVMISGVEAVAAELGLGLKDAVWLAMVVEFDPSNPDYLDGQAGKSAT